MFSKTWRVYGREGHRQRLSFGESVHLDCSDNLLGTRVIDCACADKTGTNDYVDVTITRNTEQECIDEFDGQLTDGLFENSRVGRIVEL